MAVPFLGRMSIYDYLSLFGFFIAAVLETIVRIVTIALPNSVIRSLYRGSKNVFNFLSSSTNRQQRSIDEKRTSEIHDASDFVSLCAISGYYAEEHVVQTQDGYLLGVHRLCYKKGDDTTVRVNTSASGFRKKVVYLHHGLLMNSEVWVCITDEQRCLPFALVEQGYDVWLGNNRGNKYSKKSIHSKSDSAEFWNFSMDEFAFRDIPDTIDYILNATHSKSISYIGFSQGTAQAFAALSVHPMLNEKVNLYIALAPAMSPAGLSFGVVDAMVKASPNVLYLLFGRKSILSSATMWQEILYPPLWVRLIDVSLTFLFNWSGVNIALNQKLAAYSHLYSFTSTKSVVHWFQIMRSESFQMYDDEGTRPFAVTTGAKYYKVARYPTQNIKVPVLLLWGGRDSLVDINTMLKELPKHTKEIEVPHYEHLDFLWANRVDELVFPHVFRALELHSNSSEELNLTAPRPKRLFSMDGQTKQITTLNGESEDLEAEEDLAEPETFRDYSDADKARAFDYFVNTLGEGELRRRMSTPTSPLPQPYRRSSALRKASQLSTQATSVTASSPPLTPSDAPAKIRLPHNSPAPFVYRSGSSNYNPRPDLQGSAVSSVMQSDRSLNGEEPHSSKTEPVAVITQPESPPTNARWQEAGRIYTLPTGLLGDGTVDPGVSDGYLNHGPSPIRVPSKSKPSFLQDRSPLLPPPRKHENMEDFTKPAEVREKSRSDSISSAISHESGRTLSSIRGSEGHQANSQPEKRKPSFKAGGIHIPPSTAASSVTTSEAETTKLEAPKPTAEKKGRRRKNHQHHNNNGQKKSEASASAAAPAPSAS